LDLGGPAAVVLVNSIEIVESVTLQTAALTIDEASVSEHEGGCTATPAHSSSTTGDLVAALSSVPAAGGVSLVSLIVHDSRADPDGDSSDGGMPIMASPVRPLTGDQEFVAGHPADAKPESLNTLRQDLADLLFANSEENGLWW
jgi:hypothetical protein